MKHHHSTIRYRVTALLLTLLLLVGMLPATNALAAADSVKLESFGYSGVHYQSAQLGSCMMHQMRFSHNGQNITGFCADKGAGMGTSLVGQKWGNPKPITDPTVKIFAAFFYSNSLKIYTDKAKSMGLEANWSSYTTWYMNALVQAIIWRYKEGTLNNPTEDCAEEMMYVFNILDNKTYTSIDDTYDGISFRDWVQHILDQGTEVWGDWDVYEYSHTGAGSSEHPSGSVQAVIIAEPHGETTRQSYDLIVRKVDATNPNKSLPGAQFHVQSTSGSFSKDVVTGSDGTYTLKNVPAGTYEITELEAPEGYSIDNAGPQYAVVPNGGSNTVTVTFMDTPEITGEGTIRKVDSDDPTKGLAGAVIKITGVDNDFTGTYVTGEGGYLTDLNWKDLPIGSYTAEEVTPPEGYSISPDVSKVKQTFEWDGKTPVALVFENDAKVKVRLIKQDESGNPLAGVVFNVIKDGQIIASEATDAAGTITVPNVTEGMYTFVEVSAPEGYCRMYHPVVAHVDQATVNGGGTVTVTAVNQRLAQLILHKVDADTEEPVPGTVFSVKFADGRGVQDVQVASDGAITLEDLQPGIYEISEKSVPEPYLLDADPQLVTLEAGESRDVYFRNHKAPTIEILKTDSITGDSLSNVRFQVWYASNDTETGEYNDLGVFTTDEHGRINLDGPANGLRDGWFRVKELEPPRGYSIKDSDTQEAFIPAGKAHTFRFENTPLSAIVVWKFDDVTGEAISNCTFRVSYLGGDTSGTGGAVIGTYTTSANGSFTITGLKAGYYIVEEIASDPGHVISSPPQTVYISGKDQDIVQLFFGNAPKGSVLVKKVSAKDGSPLSDVEFLVTEADGTVVGDANDKFVTDSSGSFTVEGLDPGTTLVIKETRAKPGYLLDDAPQTVVVKPGRTVTLEYRNQPQGGIVLHKLDSVTKKPLEGVQFKITYSNGANVDADGGQLSSNGLYWTDENGQIVLDGITGTLVVTEVETIPGYTIHEETRSQTVVVNPGDTQELWFYNDPVGGVEIIKVNEADKTERIPGVTFEIRKMDDALVDTVTTGDDGRVYVALEDGAYYAVEVECPAKYKLDSTPHYFEVKDGYCAPLTVTNRAYSGILIHKVDASTGDGIYGVTFLLYDNKMNPIGQYTSDDCGYVYIEDLPADGRYYIRELEAEGYNVDKQLKTVYVEAGGTTEITWENTAITGQIQLYKYAAEANPITGAAASTPLSGAVYEIVHERSGKVVDYITTDARGVAASKPLPLGRYKLVEVTAPAYWQLDSETVFDVTLEYPGQIIKLSAFDKPSNLDVSITKRGNAQVLVIPISE